MRSKSNCNAPNPVEVAHNRASSILPPITSLVDTHSPIPENEPQKQTFTSPMPMSSSSQQASAPDLTDGFTSSDKSSSRSNSYPTDSLVRLPGNLASIMNMSEQGVKKFGSYNLSPQDKESMDACLPQIQFKMRPVRTQSHPIMSVDQKRLERLKNNREAASRCRVKQKQKIQKQEDNLKWYQGENDKLSREVLDLKMKIMDLKMLIFGHQCSDGENHLQSVKPASVKRSLSDQSSASSNRHMAKRISPSGPHSDDSSSPSYSQRTRSDTSTP